MKRIRRGSVALNPNQEESLLARQGKKEFESNYIDLLHLLAQGLDKAIQGEDLYFTLGMTRDKTGLLLVITWDGDKSYLVAGSLAGLSLECQSWIDEG